MGCWAQIAKTFTLDDVRAFSELSGDKNPIHIDPEYAVCLPGMWSFSFLLTFQKTTRYQRCICHGLLSASLISAVAAQTLPGPGSIYLSQSLQFRLPVYVDDTVTAFVRVIGLDRSRDPPRGTFETVCVNQGGQVVIKGEAVVTIPKEKLPAGSESSE